MQESILENKQERMKQRQRKYWLRVGPSTNKKRRDATKARKEYRLANNIMSPHCRDLTGQRSGMLKVVEYAGTRQYPGHNCTTAVWKCVCDCGGVKLVPSKGITSGHTKSCGCVKYRGLNILGDTPHNRLRYGEARFHDLFVAYKRSAKARNREFALDIETFRALTKGNCFYCGKEPAQQISAGKDCYGHYIYNGVDRIDNALGYVAGNVRSCCKHCNTAKASMTECEFLAWITKVYNHSVLLPPRTRTGAKCGDGSEHDRPASGPATREG